MKTVAKIFFLLLGTCLLFSACVNPYAGEGEWITVTFKLGNGDNSRATGFLDGSGNPEITDSSELAHYVRITHVSTGQNISAIVTNGDDPSFTATGPAGTWKIEIQAVWNGGPGPHLYAIHSGTYPIDSGVTPPSISMERPIPYINSLGSPANLSLFVPLSTGVWSSIITSIGASVVSSVNLDLKRCTGIGSGPGGLDSSGVFRPNRADGTLNSGKTKIISITLPDAATSIEAGIFASPTFTNFFTLTTVDLGGVIEIHEFAFTGLSTLTSVTLPKATTIGDGAFQNTGLISVDFPNVIMVGEDAFRDCASLSSVTLPNMTTIGNNAFGQCTALTNVNFPNVNTIHTFAFWACSSLTTAIIPKANSIGNNAFALCTALTSVDLRDATNPITLGNTVFTNIDGTDRALDIYFPIVTSLSELPRFGTNMFFGAYVVPLTVNIRTGSPSSLSFYNDSAWQTGFKGAGWNGSSNSGGTVNNTITVNTHPNYN